MGNDVSKPIKQADDASKNLIIEALEGKNTFGFDVDSIYYFDTHNLWVVIEFLKCDHAFVRPTRSHPNRYWKNWRKFASLWKLKEDLEGVLILVNYEDEAHAVAQKRKEREFHVFEVLEMEPTGTGSITKEEVLYTGNFDGFKAWFQRLNDSGVRK